MDFANTSRARHEALEQLVRRGEPLPAPLSPAPARPDIVDAELVPPQEAHAYPPSAAVDGAEGIDPPDAPADESAPTTAAVPPPPRSLNQDEAAVLMRESRKRAGHVRRKGCSRRMR